MQNRTREINNLMHQKTDLFVNLAHETKTPLTLMQNYPGKYLVNYPPDKEPAMVKYNIDKLTSDIINFLDIEKLERAQLFYNHDQICDLSTLAQNKNILFKETALQKQINLEWLIENDFRYGCMPGNLKK